MVYARCFATTALSTWTPLPNQYTIEINMTRLILSFAALLLLAGCASTSGINRDTSAPSTTQTVPATLSKAGKNSNNLLRGQTSRSTALDTVVQDDLWVRLRLGFDLPELNNKRVAYYEKRFTRNPEQFYAMLDRAQWFLPYILSEVEKRGYPTEIALLPAVESAYVTDAKSRSSASGLWQFMPSTGKLYHLKQDWWYDGRRDPVLSTQAALMFLGELEQRFDGDWFHAIAAYNAGGWTVERAIKRNTGKNKSTHFTNLSLRRETRDYVPKLIAFRNIFLKPEYYGLSLPALGNDLQFARLDAGSQIDVALFAKKAGIDGQTMRFLNSAYRRNITPPNGPHILYLPVNTLGNAKITLAALSRNDRLRWAHYRVQKGDVLGRIANRHGVSVASIQQSNKIRSTLIHPGDILLIPVIPGNATVASVPRDSNGKVTHHVRQGDTLWDIAQRYGVKVSQISQWNQIEQSNTLRLGQKLTIYTRS